MGILDIFKKGISSLSNKPQEDLGQRFEPLKSNLKSASDFIAKFLEGVKEFQPAHRHFELYNHDVKNRLVNTRNGIKNSIIFINERSKNTINTLNPVKSYDQLRNMIDSWINLIKNDDEKSQDILKILEIEMWSEERARRNFPIPSNKVIVCGYLLSACSYLKQARDELDNYINLDNQSEVPNHHRI